jgi:toxin CptA
LLDTQSLLLVRLDEPTQRARWLWLERRARPERWQDLRRAIYSRALASSVVAGEVVAAR